MPIRVISMDHDGCLMHYDCKMSKHAKRITEFNQELISTLRDKNSDYSRTITFVGSARQSRPVDIINSAPTYHIRHSCFPAIREFTEALGAELDPFLLADVYGELE